MCAVRQAVLKQALTVPRVSIYDLMRECLLTQGYMQILHLGPWQWTGIHLHYASWLLTVNTFCMGLGELGAVVLAGPPSSRLLDFRYPMHNFVQGLPKVWSTPACYTAKAPLWLA